jgi:hypothetical protein
MQIQASCSMLLPVHQGRARGCRLAESAESVESADYVGFLVYSIEIQYHELDIPILENKVA